MTLEVSKVNDGMIRKSLENVLRSRITWTLEFTTPTTYLHVCMTCSLSQNGSYFHYGLLEGI